MNGASGACLPFFLEHRQSDRTEKVEPDGHFCKFSRGSHSPRDNTIARDRFLYGFAISAVFFETKAFLVFVGD